MGIRITERRPYSTVSRPKYVQKFRTKSGNFGFCAEFFAHRARNSIISDETGFSLPKKRSHYKNNNLCNQITSKNQL